MYFVFCIIVYLYVNALVTNNRIGGLQFQCNTMKNRCKCKAGGLNLPGIQEIENEETFSL